MKILISGLVIAFQSGGFFTKVIAATMLSFVSTTPIIYFINKYFFSDWETALMLIMALVVDLFIRLYTLWRQHSLSIIPIHLFFDKLMKYGAVLFIMNVFEHYIIKDTKSIVAVGFDYFSVIIQATMFVAIIISIFENLGELGNDSFPPKSWLRRLKNFRDSGNGELEPIKKKERRSQPASENTSSIPIVSNITSNKDKPND